MESNRRMGVTSLLGLIILATGIGAEDGHFYSESCPNASAIVKQTVNKILKENKNLAAGLLRLHFHDCFVRGCDASILLDFSTNKSEKNALPNASVKGYEAIDQIKAALEDECPKTVSCADILALAARDAVVKVGGKSWSVALGRKDGFNSTDTEANQNIPSPFSTFDQLVQNFAAKGLSQEDMVVLSGAHTIGRTSCDHAGIQRRLYNFDGVAGATDPSIDPLFAEQLKKKCPENEKGGRLSMDPSKTTFDTLFFKAVLAHKGLFESDANLLTNPAGEELVKRYSKPGSSFLKDFASAMKKMSNIQWASEGEVRLVCSAVNS